MLISINLDKNNIVWENKVDKEEMRIALLVKLNNENKLRYKKGKS